MHLNRLVDDVTHQHDHLGYGEFNDRTRVAERSVEYSDTFLCCRFQINLVGSDTKSTDSHQPVCVLQHSLGHHRLRTNTENRYVLYLLNQFFFSKRCMISFNVESFSLEQFDSHRMNILKKQHVYPVLRIRDSGIEFVQIQKLIQAWRYVVGLALDIFTGNVFREGKELVGQSRSLYFIVGVSVTNHIDIPGKVKPLKLLNFSTICRQGIINIKAYYSAF